jgi:hypothetical protein
LAFIAFVFSFFYFDFKEALGKLTALTENVQEAFIFDWASIQERHQQEHPGNIVTTNQKKVTKNVGDARACFGLRNTKVGKIAGGLLIAF